MKPEDQDGYPSDPLLTRGTLLVRLRDGDDGEAWRLFDAQYRELILRFCRRLGLQHADAEDVVQIVLNGIARAMPGFEYDPGKGRFRDYLYRCTRNAVLRQRECQTPARLALGTDSGVPLDSVGAVAPDAEAEWEREWVHHHFRRALETISARADERSILVLEAAMGGRSVAAIAEDNGMNEMAVYKVLQRMRDRLRERVALQIREEDMGGA